MKRHVREPEPGVCGGIAFFETDLVIARQLLQLVEATRRLRQQAAALPIPALPQQSVNALGAFLGPRVTPRTLRRPARRRKTAAV